MADDLQPSRQLLQHLGDILAQPGQPGGVGAAAAAGQHRLVQDGLARQVRWQRLADGLLARLGRRRERRFRRGSGLGLVLLQVADQHLQLADLRRQPFRGLAVLLAPGAGQLHLELVDLEPAVQQQRIALGQRRVPLRQQAAQRGDLGIGVGYGAVSTGQF
jgi:hypothetical protein